MSVVVQNTSHTYLQKKIRNDILYLEAMISKLPGAVFGDNDLFPVKHTFAGYIYTREMFIPKGGLLTGRIWFDEFPVILSKGEIIVISESTGVKTMKAPFSFVSMPGDKRVIFAKEDSVFTTIHHNPERITDKDILLDKLSCVTYQEYEKHLLENKNIVSENCGIKSLRKLIELKTVSLKSILEIAKDNGVNLYPYWIEKEELTSIPLPAIVHSENHFDYIYKKEDFDFSKKYTGYVLLTKKCNYKKIKKSELEKIKGESGIVTAAIVTTAGALITLGVTEGRKSVTECGRLCREQCRAKTGWLFSGRKACISDCKAKCTKGLTPSQQAEEKEKEERERKTRTNMYIVAGILFAIAIGFIIYYLKTKK